MKFEENQQEKNIPKKMRFIDKLYATIGAAVASALTIGYVLAFIGVISSAPLFALGIAAGSIYFAGSLLEEANILNFQGLRDLVQSVLPKTLVSQEQQLNLSPDQQQIETMFINLIKIFIGQEIQPGIIVDRDFLGDFNVVEGFSSGFKNALYQLFYENNIAQEKYDDIFNKLMKRLDPDGIIKNIGDLRPLAKSEVAEMFLNHLKNELKIDPFSIKSDQEISKLLGDFLQKNNIAMDPHNYYSEIFNKIDPDCIRLPRPRYTQPMFLLQDESLRTNYKAPEDLASQIYLKVLSEITSANIKMMLPVNPAILEKNGFSTDHGEFSRNFYLHLKRNLADQNLGEEQYRQLAADIIDKIGPISPDMAREITPHYDMPQNKFQDMSYKDQITYICKRTVNELGITNDDTSVNSNAHARLIRTFEELQIPNDKLFIMQQDALHFIYPKHYLTPAKDDPQHGIYRHESCPIIEEKIEIFEKKSENVMDAGNIDAQPIHVFSREQEQEQGKGK